MVANSEAEIQSHHHLRSSVEPIAPGTSDRLEGSFAGAWDRRMVSPSSLASTDASKRSERPLFRNHCASRIAWLALVINSGIGTSCWQFGAAALSHVSRRICFRAASEFFEHGAKQRGRFGIGHDGLPPRTPFRINTSDARALLPMLRPSRIFSCRAAEWSRANYLMVQTPQKSHRIVLSHPNDSDGGR